MPPLFSELKTTFFGEYRGVRMAIHCQLANPYPYQKKRLTLLYPQNIVVDL